MLTRRLSAPRPLACGTVLLVTLPLLSGCADPPCPGLPPEIPSDWGTVPPGLDTDAWDTKIRTRMREGCIPALSVSLVTEQDELMSAAWGYADVESLRPVTVETPFMMASASKAVDALALVAARDEGLLEFDEPVSDLVGFEVRNHRIGRRAPPIRLHHLATHSSGIRDNWDVLDPTYAPGDPDVGLGDFLRGYLSREGTDFSKRDNFYSWPAGREWFYSNVGAALAALAVEVRASQPFDTYCDERLFAPLGLRHTGWFLADFADPDAIARPHEIRWDGWHVREHYGFATWPDGQLRTTPSELGRMLRLVLGDGEFEGQQILAPGVFETVTTRPIDGIGDWYIQPYIEDQYLFWFGMTLGDRWLVGHDGDDYGVSTEMFFDAKSRVGVVLAANVDDGANGGAAREQTRSIQLDLYDLGEELSR